MRGTVEGRCGCRVNERGRQRTRNGKHGTFFSLFFSAISSLPALAACRFSCLAVNWSCGCQEGACVVGLEGWVP